MGTNYYLGVLGLKETAMEEIKSVPLTKEEIISNYARRNYWVSWYHHEEMGDFCFEDDQPCWESEFTTGVKIFVAAIRANCVNSVTDKFWTGATSVKDIVASAYDKDKRGYIAYRYIINKPEGWAPFCEKFPRADWMKWGK